MRREADFLLAPVAEPVDRLVAVFLLEEALLEVALLAADFVDDARAGAFFATFFEGFGSGDSSSSSPSLSTAAAERRPGFAAAADPVRDQSTRFA